MMFSPVPSREYVIVWEVRPEEAVGGLFEFGSEQRVVLRRTWRAKRGEPLPSFFKLKQFRRVPVVVSLHPNLARTFILPFRLSRKKSEGLLSPEQLQALLRDFLAKTTFEMRRLAADELGVEDLDSILLDARLTGLCSDGKEVREDQPIAGRKIEGYLRVLLTARAVFHDLHDLLHSGREIFFTERGPATLSVLSRYIDGPLSLIDLEAQGGWIFTIDPSKEEVLKKGHFQWKAEDLVEALASAWGLSTESSREAYEMLAAGEASQSVLRWAQSLIAPILASFEAVLTKKKIDTPVYIRTMIPFNSGIAGIPEEKLLDVSGISFHSRIEKSFETSLLLMPFLEYYYYRGDRKAHKNLTRHIHWISK